VPTFQGELGFAKTAAQPAGEGVDLAQNHGCLSGRDAIGPGLPGNAVEGQDGQPQVPSGSWLEQKEGRGDVEK